MHAVLSTFATSWPRSSSALAFALASLALLGCGAEPSSTPNGSSGGAVTAAGGVGGGGGSSAGSGAGGMAAGGAVSTGGATASGGVTSGGAGAGSGGSSAVGGNRDAGATAGAGGTTAADAGTGGRTSFDGAAGRDATAAEVTPTTTGGTSTGGRSGTGGVTGTGGIAGTGGVRTTGGVSGTGGSAAGGTTSTGTGAGGGLGSSDGKTPITVWMAGDSTMAGDTCAGGGWGDQLGALLNANVTIENRSVAGRSIQTWLYEKNVSSTMGTNKECTLTATTYSANWNAMLDATSGMKKGDYLFIEFGINDGDSACPRHVGTTLFQTYLATMAKAAKERGTQPVFLTSTSYIQCSGQTATANRGFRTETKAAGTANEVPVIDMSPLSAAMYTAQGLCPNSGDYTSTTSKVGVFFCNDHTHFAAPGALEIARVAMTAMVDQGIGLASYRK